MAKIRSLMTVNGSSVVHGECPGLTNIPVCRQGGQNNRLTKFREVALPINCRRCLAYACCADEQPAAEVVEVGQPAEVEVPTSYAQTITTLARQFRQADEQGTMTLDVRSVIVRAAAAAGRAASIPVEVALTELFEEIEAPAPAGARPVPPVVLPAPAPVETRSCAQLVVELAAEAREAEAAGTMTEAARTLIVRQVSDAARREGGDPVAALTRWYDLAHAPAAA